MPNVAADGTAFIISTSTCAAAVGSTLIGSTGSGTSVTLTASASGAVAGVYSLCARWTASSPYVAISSFNIIAGTSNTPPAIPTLAGQAVSVAGSGLLNVSADASAFVMAATCAAPTPSAVSSIASVFVSGASVTLTINASASSPASLRLCMRASSTSPYFDMGPLNVMGITSITPAFLAAGAVTPASLAVVGAGLVDVSADAAAFAITGNASCAAPTSAVTSSASTFVSATATTLSVSYTAAAAGAYRVCLRAATTAPYFDTGRTVTIGG